MANHQLVLAISGALETWEYNLLLDYSDRTLKKIEAGRKGYGMDYLKRSDKSFMDEIDAELADLSGWAAMRYIKLHKVTTDGGGGDEKVTTNKKEA